MNTTRLQPEELIRYSRHFNLPGVGIDGQEKLKSAKVLCVGAGGLGSPVLLYLAAAGVGTLGIIDHDEVDLSNLQRQILYTQQDIKKSKVLAAKEKIKELNPNTHVIAHHEQLTIDNAASLFANYDYIIDGTDNFTTRYVINDICFQLKKPFVYASILQFEGQCSVFLTDDTAPCYRCLFPSAPPSGLMPNCAEGGVFGVLPGILGSIQATEIIKLILNLGTSLAGRLLTFDALTLRFKEYQLQKNPNCRLCVHQDIFSYQENSTVCQTQPHACPQEKITVFELQRLQQSKTPFTLLDVREPHEYAICNLGGTLIPLGQLQHRAHEIDKNKWLIIHCKSDARSQRACQLLKEQGFENLTYLQGGILAWAKNIAPDMATY